ncbi:MAG: tetratricopeptide repeat protein, partial [Limibaculum sp.]
REASASVYGNLGVLYNKQGKLDQAGDAHAKSLAIETELGRRDGMAADNGNLAILRAQQGRLPEARQHAGTARALYAEMGMDRDVAKAEALLEQIDAAMRG